MTSPDDPSVPVANGLIYAMRGHDPADVESAFRLAATLDGRRDLARSHGVSVGDYSACGDPECLVCGIVACPHREPLHFHHDGCPACYLDERSLSLQVVSSDSDVPDPSAALVCLDVDSLGGIAPALVWAERNGRRDLYLAVGSSGGDMTALSAFGSAVLSPPEDRSPQGWRRAVYPLWFALRNPELCGLPAGEPGAVDPDEFDEHVRAAASGDGDDSGGATC